MILKLQLLITCGRNQERLFKQIRVTDNLTFQPFNLVELNTV